jgi:sigma-B regulation protein RsbU (phosphoserine phosphatase)
MLHWQGGLFGRGTQNLVLRNELAATLRRLDAELQAVGEIQRSLLPESLPHIPGFELAADYQTSARAGGDYYDFFPLPNGQWGILVADVSGHGTPAAVLMAITHAIAHTQPGTHTPPSQMLQHLNHHLVQTYTRWGTFVTAFYAVLDPATRTLTYSRAGHNPPRLLRDGQVRSLDAVGTLPMGITQENEYEQAVVTLDPGDLLVLYTDGITEAMRPGRSGKDLFETTRLDATLLACGGASPAECVRRVREAVDAFTGNSPATDDRTMIAIRCTPVGS